MRYRLHAAAKARGKTLTEYLAGGSTRLMHIHEELAFDSLESMLESTTQEVMLKDGGNNAKSASGRRQTRQGNS
jgi:hypothetical protein